MGFETTRTLIAAIGFFLLPAATAQSNPAADPLVIGQTFVMHSTVLDEDRRINVYRPATANLDEPSPLPVLYMPDGGMTEDFLHIAGLLQVSVGNGTMRPFLLVGIENTERRRDLTPLTSSDEDRKIAPRVGGAEAFRSFLRDELMPQISQRYAVTDERAIVGESAAGLFIVDTWMQEPALFQHYLAFDPSLWWDDARLPREAAGDRDWNGQDGRTLFIASSSEPSIDKPVREFVAALRQSAIKGLELEYTSMPQETHSSIYHPAALLAFRRVLRPSDKD